MPRTRGARMSRRARTPPRNTRTESCRRPNPAGVLYRSGGTRRSVLCGVLLGPLRAVRAQDVECMLRFGTCLERSHPIDGGREESLLDLAGLHVVPELVLEVLRHRVILCPRMPPVT